MTSKKTKEDLLQSLQNQAQIVKTAETSLSAMPVNETDEDYVYARDGIKELISTSKAAIEKMYELAADSESPRAFEVLNDMIKSTAVMNEQLLDIIKKKVDCSSSRQEQTPGVVNNNAIFVGTTVDLQRLIKTNICIDT
jgi:hypothetical protein